MTPEQKAWIDNASLDDLLRRWRFAKAGEDEIFQGDTGTYYAKVLFVDHRDRSPERWTAASKRVGW